LAALKRRFWAFRRVALAGALLGVLLAAPLAAGPAWAGDPAFVSFSGGYFDFNRQKDEQAELRLEYRSNYELWHFKPFVAGSVVSNDMTFLGGGVLIDIYFGRRWVATPSFAATWWRGKNKDLDLGYPLEFRSQFELAYRFDDRSRLGVAVAHYSNAGLGDDNPGTEIMSVYYSIPVEKLFGSFTGFGD